MVEFKCPSCNKKAFKSTGHYNRAVKIGAPLFCSQKCFGISRRDNKSLAQKKEEKRLYDIEYIKKNLQKIKLRKKEYFQKNYAENPEKYRAIRKKRMNAHVKYCQQPAYKAKKHTYDRQRYAKQRFGPYWESHVALMAIGEEIEKHITKYDIRIENQTYNKALRRARNEKVKRSYT